MYNAFRRACAEDPIYQTTYPGVDVGDVFNSWVQNPGAPVLNVDVNMATGSISITQVFITTYILSFAFTDINMK